MALKAMTSGKAYVPTTVPTGIYGSNVIGNGVVNTANLRDRGYSNSMDGTSGTSGPGGTVKVDTGKAGGVRSTGGTGSASTATSNAGNAYNALLAAYQAQQSDYDNYLAEMRAAAQAAYDRGMNALNSAYDNQINSLSDNLNETRNQLANQYNRSKQNITDDAASSLRQAYINRMLSEKNLGQQMTALGLNGGATESTLANMANNYGNARNNINTTQNRNLANLEGNYSDNLSQAQQAYNSAVASANLQKAQQAMALENALANNQISALGDYQSLMSNRNSQYLDLLKAAIANGASFTFDPTSANNAFNAINVQQASNPDYVSNLTALQELMANSPGVSMPGMTVVNQNTTTNPYLDILRQLAAQRA